MNWFELHPVTTSLITFMLGGFLAVVANYIMVVVKFSEDMSFIKGQLSQLVESYEKIDEIIEKHAKIEAEFLIIQKHFLNGGTVHARRT